MNSLKNIEREDKANCQAKFTANGIADRKEEISTKEPNEYPLIPYRVVSQQLEI